MNCSIRHALVLSFLVLAPEAKPGMAPSTPPRIPTGVYAVVEMEKVVGAPDPTTGCPATPIDTYLTCYYAGLLNNPAIAGLTLQVYWATLNPNSPTDPNPYFWNYVDDAFTSVHGWNAANPSAPPKAIQLIVTPGFNSPEWERDKLASCDGLFDSSKPYPTSACGKATFADSKEPALGNVLPMPWNATYKADWKTFLTALNKQYGSDPAFVSIAVAGPTAASAEMLLPNNKTDCDMWNQLLTNAGKTAYIDQTFIDEWKNAIDMYGQIFSGITLVVATGDGLPNLAYGSWVLPSTFAKDCPKESNMDCYSEAEILNYFIESTKGGYNAKATQTSGMEAWRVGLNMGISAVRNLSQYTMTNQSISTRILGGGQFSTRFSKDPVGEGCLSKFPPKDGEKADEVLVTDIPTECLVGVTTADLTNAGYKTFKDVRINAPSDLISPEQAAYNVRWFYFDGTQAATSFGGTWGTAPLNYLQIYSDDIYYAIKATSPATVMESGIPFSVTAQTLLNQASTQVFAIAEAEPYCPSGTSCASLP